VSSERPQDGADSVETKPGFSRRTFIQGVGAGAGAVGVLVPEAQAQSAAAGELVGPGAVPISLRINGKEHKVELEPRVTLLDALRNRLDYTGAKKVCDRATCGACTVIVDNAPVYAFETPDGFYYGFPSLDGATIKIAEHMSRNAVSDPATVPRDLVPGELNGAGKFATRYLRHVSPDPTRHAVCMYTMTPDGHFILDTQIGRASCRERV